MIRCSAVFFLLLSGWILRGAPAITHLSPLGVVPGKRTVLTFHGTDLTRATNLWTSFNATARPLTNSEKSAMFELLCGESASGVQAVQIAGPEGVSDFHLLLIDSLSAREAHAKHSPHLAEPVEAPVALDSVLEAEQTDFFRLKARAGECYAIEAIASRIGSEMDPVAEVRDLNGNELSFCDDEPGVWRDARFVFRPPGTADYLISVHDVGFGGGLAFFYRLRITREPLVWFTYPLPDPSEPAAPFLREGTGSTQEPPQSPANPAQPFGLPSFPSMAEGEPNDSPERAQTVQLPIILHGRIDRSNDVDYFKFQVAKPGKVLVQSQTRSLGSPADLSLLIRKLDGTVAVQSDAALPTEAAVTNSFKEPGEYLLEVRELSGTAPAGVPYRIRIDSFRPGLIASTESNRLELKPGAEAPLKVTLSRFDYDGPVTLHIDPPVQGLDLTNATIPEKKNEAEIKVRASNDLRPGTLLHLNLLAKGTNQIELTARLSTKPALRKSFPLMPILPWNIDGLVAIGIRE